MRPSNPPSPEQLLQHAAWLRRLARGLVGDAAADDLVQDRWIAALRHPPDGERPLRPWLATVLRNLARMAWRSGESRGRRETESLADAASVAPATPEDVVTRAQLQHRLVELVLGMPEPYRASLLLRYFEGLTTPRPPGEAASQLSRHAARCRDRAGFDRIL